MNKYLVYLCMVLMAAPLWAQTDSTHHPAPQTRIDSVRLQANRDSVATAAATAAANKAAAAARKTAFEQQQAFLLARVHFWRGTLQRRRAAPLSKADSALLPNISQWLAASGSLHPFDDKGADSIRRAAHLLYLAQTVDSLQHISSSILHVDLFEDIYNEQSFSCCAIDPYLVNFRVFNQAGKKIHDFRSLYDLTQATGEAVYMLMNGGMYEDNRQAKGLLISAGAMQTPLDTFTTGYGNFYMQPNGVVGIDSSGKAFLLRTQSYATLAKRLQPRYATQSGPMTQQFGNINPLFNPNSPNRLIRNAVGLRPDGQLVFAISRGSVTFYELAKLLEQQGCTEGLYLDGTVSRAFFAGYPLDWLDIAYKLGPIIVISK